MRCLLDRANNQNRRLAATNAQTRGLGPWAVASTYAGAIVGAGFVTGQEIQAFFLRFHGPGWIGLATAVLLLGVAGAGLAEASFGTDANTSGGAVAAAGDPMYQAVASMAGRTVARLAQIVVMLVAAAVLVVMVAGGAAVIGRVTGLDEQAAEWITAAAGAVFVLGQTRWVTSLNAVLIPLLLAIVATNTVVTVASAGLSLSPGPARPEVNAQLVFPALMSGAAYAAFNFVLAAAPLSYLGAHGQTAAAGFVGGWIGSGIVGILAAMEMAVMASRPAPANSALPLIDAVAPQGGVWHVLVASALWAAILSTVVSLGWALGESLRWPPFRPGVRAFVYVLATPLVFPLGFAVLVRVVYPVLGAVATPFLLMWILGPAWRRRKTRS